jgi:hypothetical protein
MSRWGWLIVDGNAYAASMELDESKVTNGTAYSGISEKYLKLSKPG